MRYADEVKWQMAICAASVAAACRNPVTVAVGVAATPQTKSNILRSDYVGSAACKPCHADVFAKWITSPMHKMTRDPAEAEIRAPFAGEIFAFKDDRVDLFRAGDGRFMRLHSDKQPDRLFRVTRVIGNHYREDFAGVEVTGVEPGAHIIGDHASPLPVHPTEIYLSLLNMLTFVALYFAISRRKRFDGQVFAWLLILKGVFRSFVEIWRDDERGVLFGWLSTSQIISLPLIAFGIYLLVSHRGSAPLATPAA